MSQPIFQLFESLILLYADEHYPVEKALPFTVKHFCMHDISSTTIVSSLMSLGISSVSYTHLSVQRKIPELWPGMWTLHHNNASAHDALNVRGPDSHFKT